MWTLKHEFKPRYLICRVIGHWFNRMRWTMPGSGYLYTSWCANCGAKMNSKRWPPDQRGYY